MKKWISLLLVLAIALSFAACGKETKSRRPATPVYNTNIPQANPASSGASQSDSAQPDAAQPETAQSDPAQPEAVPSDIPADAASQTDASAPEASRTDASASNAAAPNASGEVHKEGTGAQNASANEDSRTGSASLVNPISEYLTKSGLAQELIFPGGADGATVQNGELHFNPHGADASDWYEQIEMAAAIVSDDGEIEGSALTGVHFTVEGSPVTITCTAVSDDDWYLVIS